MAKDSKYPYPYNYQNIVTDASGNATEIEFKDGGRFDPLTKVYVGGFTVFRHYIIYDANGNVKDVVLA